MLINPLAQSILDTIDQMFERPTMFASSAASFEEQFYVLFTLVAPHTDWGMDELQAAEKLKAFAFEITRNNHPMSSVLLATDDMAHIIQGWYRNGFQLPSKKEAN